jgi:hypothetical protein
MRIFILTIIVLLSNPILAAESGLVVIASSHPDFQKGMIIDHTQTFKLESGESIKLVSSAGKVTLLQGPYSGTIIFDSKPDDNSVLQSVSDLVKGSQSTDFTLAIFRNSSVPALTDRLDIWGVDIRESGSYCVRESQPVYLWWPRPVDEASVILSRLSNALSTEIKWPGKIKYVAWPETIPLNDKADYSIVSDAASQEITVEVSLIPANIESEMEIVAWMSDRDCRKQATRLLGKLLSDSQ